MLAFHAKRLTFGAACANFFILAGFRNHICSNGMCIFLFPPFFIKCMLTGSRFHPFHSWGGSACFCVFFFFFFVPRVRSNMVVRPFSAAFRVLLLFREKMSKFEVSAHGCEGMQGLRGRHAGSRNRKRPAIFTLGSVSGVVAPAAYCCMSNAGSEARRSLTLFWFTSFWRREQPAESKLARGVVDGVVMYGEPWFKI